MQCDTIHTDSVFPPTESVINTLQDMTQFMPYLPPSVRERAGKNCEENKRPTPPQYWCMTQMSVVFWGLNGNFFSQRHLCSNTVNEWNFLLVKLYEFSCLLFVPSQTRHEVLCKHACIIYLHLATHKLYWMIH